MKLFRRRSSPKLTYQSLDNEGVRRWLNFNRLSISKEVLIPDARAGIVDRKSVGLQRVARQEVSVRIDDGYTYNIC